MVVFRRLEQSPVLETLRFESTRDKREVPLRALGWERREGHQRDDGPPSAKFHLVKRSVIIVKDLPLGVFAFTAALLRWGQKRCTHTRGKLARETRYVLWGKGRDLSLAHPRNETKSKTFKRRNASKPHLPIKPMMFCWSVWLQAKKKIPKLVAHSPPLNKHYAL